MQNSDIEIWKTIPGYEGFYEASTLGRIRSVDRIFVMKNGVKRPTKGKLLNTSIKNSGYFKVSLCKNGIAKTAMVHRIIAKTFLKNPLNLPLVNHKDENKLNNCVTNLEWCTDTYNNNYGTIKERCSLSNKDRKEILQLDSENNIINEYHSVGEASRRSGICRTSISKTALHKQKTAGGYYWIFKEEYIKCKQED